MVVGYVTDPADHFSELYCNWFGVDPYWLRTEIILRVPKKMEKFKVD
jgi:hypothetical protein